MQMSDGMRAKFELLGQRFVDSLPERVVKIRAALAETVDKKTDSEEFILFRNEAHKLAGSGASFGYNAISEQAKELELYLDDVIAAKSDPSHEQQQRIRELVEQLSGECVRALRPTAAAPQTSTSPQTAATHQTTGTPSTVVGAGEPVPAAEFERVTRVVVFAEGDHHISEDFVRQIGFFGLRTKRVAHFTDSFSTASELRGSVEKLVVIVDRRFLMANTDRIEELKELRASNTEEVQIVLLSDVDDFDTRLFGVRLGGDAFFSTPVEIPRLVDCIDRMTQESDHTPFHVMIIDDDVEQVSMNALILQNAGMVTSVATDPRNIFKVLVETKPELILVDLYMKGCDGRELAQLIRQQEAFIGVPIIFLSVEDDPNVQIEAIRAGGDEYLTKPVRPDRLVASVTMRTRRIRSIRYYIERDSLTGLLNHSNLMEGLSSEIRKAERIGNDLCFAMIDLDHFKEVNDSYGHLTGDRVLKSLARLLQDRLRRTDLIGRYGGEEFGIVFFNTTTEHAARILNEIRESFSKIRHIHASHDFYVSFSCGVAGYSTFGSAVEIGRAADTALYRAKEMGRNCVVVAES